MVEQKKSMGRDKNGADLDNNKIGSICRLFARIGIKSVKMDSGTPMKFLKEEICSSTPKPEGASKEDNRVELDTTAGAEGADISTVSAGGGTSQIKPINVLLD